MTIFLVYICVLKTIAEAEVRFGACKTGLSPITDRFKAILMLLFHLFYVLESNFSAV